MPTTDTEKPIGAAPDLTVHAETTPLLDLGPFMTGRYGKLESHDLFSPKECAR